MDGVLVNNSRFHREAWRRLSREEGFPLTDPEFWRQAIGRPSRKPSRGSSAGRCRSGEAPAWPNGRPPSTTSSPMDHAPPVPGVVEFVRGLAAADVPRALATSAVAESAARILEGLGLAAAFPVRVTRRAGPAGQAAIPRCTSRRRPASATVCPPPASCFEDAVVGWRQPDGPAWQWSGSRRRTPRASCARRAPPGRPRTSPASHGPRSLLPEPRRHPWRRTGRSFLKTTEPPKSVTALAEQVGRDGAGSWRSTRAAQDAWQIFALLPLAQVEPTPYQRDLLEAARQAAPRGDQAPRALRRPDRRGVDRPGQATGRRTATIGGKPSRS